MTLCEYYLLYLQRLADGTQAPPEGISLPEGSPMERAIALQEQIKVLGPAEFVRRCAAAEGTDIPKEVYDAFRPEDLSAALSSILSADASDEPPQIQEPDGPRSVYEVLLDCCMLDEKLLCYLIDVLRRKEEAEFQKLALVTTRKAFTQADFLYWFATKEQRASREEWICVTLMDACLDRLAAAGEKELIAALLCGDKTTFELFRCEAPELQQLPDATFDWYESHYLSRYYPIRYMLKFNKISFPKEAAT